MSTLSYSETNMALKVKNLKMARIGKIYLVLEKAHFTLPETLKIILERFVL